jgi:hypothetical protein
MQYERFGGIDAFLKDYIKEVVFPPGIVAQLGLGANLPEDAIYPLNLGDEFGKPLDGTNKYTIHFDKATIPPVNAFWSITLYDLARETRAVCVIPASPDWKRVSQSLANPLGASWAFLVISKLVDVV